MKKCVQCAYTFVAWYPYDTGQSCPNIERRHGGPHVWILVADSGSGHIMVDIHTGHTIFILRVLPKSTCLRGVLASGHVRQLFEFFIITLD